MKIQGILFDKDGTLIDVNGTWVPIYRRLLMDLFATGEQGAHALMEKAGYDLATGQFRSGSILAAGTTRQLIDVWWPGLDEAGAAEKIRILDHDYAPLVRQSLMPLMPLEPIFTELRAMGMKLGVATNDSHISATNHMSHIGVIEHFEGEVYVLGAVGEGNESGLVGAGGDVDAALEHGPEEFFEEGHVLGFYGVEVANFSIGEEDTEHGAYVIDAVGYAVGAEDFRSTLGEVVASGGEFFKGACFFKFVKLRDTGDHGEGIPAECASLKYFSCRQHVVHDFRPAAVV